MRKGAVAVLAGIVALVAATGCSDTVSARPKPRDLDLVVPKMTFNHPRLSISGPIEEGGGGTEPPSPPPPGASRPPEAPADWPDATLISSAYTSVGFRAAKADYAAEMWYFGTDAKQTGTVDVLVDGKVSYTFPDIERSASVTLPSNSWVGTGVTFPMQRNCGAALVGRTKHEAWFKVLVNWSFLEWGRSVTTTTDNAAQPSCTTTALDGGGSGPALNDWYICYWEQIYANGVLVAIYPLGCQEI